MQIRRQRPRTAANGFEKQDEASEAFKDIIIKYNLAELHILYEFIGLFRIFIELFSFPICLHSLH